MGVATATGLIPIQVGSGVWRENARIYEVTSTVSSEIWGIRQAVDDCAAREVPEQDNVHCVISTSHSTDLFKYPKNEAGRNQIQELLSEYSNTLTEAF